MSDNIEIDLDALEKKYAEERAKRLRKDATHQFQELKKFDSLSKDPHADPDFTRDPVTENTDVLIIGGGFAGLLAACRLRAAGIDKIRIVEKAADFGGTWYWNRYPGAACDVESYIYLPLLEETGYIPTERYVKAPEIFAYVQKLAAKYELYGGALFQTEVKTVRWNAQDKNWLVGTDRNDAISARFVISCTGLLVNPKLPTIPGIERFEGHSFHTSRWDYEYTGGDSTGNLTGLANKRVGIIGTGSTGVQAIPALAQSSGQLYVFQRTPSSIDIRGNRPTDMDWANALEPGWQRARMANFAAATTGQPIEIDLVNDGWTEIARTIAGAAANASAEDAAKTDPALLVRLADAKKMEKVRRRVSAIVRDPATAEALKPYYQYFCKRPCFHDEYLEAFNQPNVALVDTKGKGVERITPKGVVVDGREYEIDCLIYATGFDWLAEYGRHTGIDIIGPGGRHLSTHWQEGVSTLHGMQTRGFPNFFIMSIIQATTSPNYVEGADEQTKHICFIIETCLKRGIETIQPTQKAEDDWVNEIIERAAPRRAFLEACTPGYYNFEGKADKAVERNEIFGGPVTEYFKRLADWREAGMPGMELT